MAKKQFSIIKKLDIYIIKKFLGTYFFSIALIISIAIIFDIQEKLEDFIKNDAPLYEIIVHYYFNFIPYFSNLFSSLFVFIAVIFFTSKMAVNSEIIAIHASGVSFFRFVLPYLAGATVIALISWILIMYVIPESNKIRLNFEAKYVYIQWNFHEKELHRQVKPGIFMYIDRYNGEDQIGHKFTLETFDGNTLKSKFVADYIQWDSVKQKWKANEYYIRTINGNNENVVYGKEIDTTFYMSPKELKKREYNVDKMTLSELNEYIKEQKMHGAENIEVYEVQKHQRWAWPFSTFILTLMGVGISNRKRKGGIGLNIGLGLLLSFAYILFMQVSTTFAINSGVDPMISVWIPNIIYSIICFFIIKRAII